ncbi:unannotated protein [freshwater metagenome]|uniref:Unannotated protein n=1 Tax=freshwater metagenome TaxID=449393 RepID=A0A6J6S566_9ZZZZ
MLVASGAAVASDPADSTLVGPKKSGTVTTTFTSAIQGTGRLDPTIPCSAFMCDTHTLTINVPASYWKKHTGSLAIQVAWTGPENDFDLAVYDAAGTEVATSGEALTEAEAVTIDAPAPGAYTIEITSYLATPGTEVTGTATLTATATKKK